MHILLRDNLISKTTSRCSKKLKLALYNIFIAPTNIRDRHWILILVVLDLKVVIIDSYKKLNFTGDIKVVVNALLNAAQNSHKQTAFNWDNWRVYFPDDMLQ